jgi:WD40 repeat protein
MTTASLTPAFTNKFTFGEPKLQTDGDILAIAFGQDGWLYSVEELGILRKWNPVTGQQLDWCSLSDMETLWSFSADARVLASASDDLTVWDASSGRLLTSIPQPAWVTAMAFAPDASFVATGHDDGAVNYWDAPGHHSVFPKSLTYHKKPISAVAVSPNGKWLAVASEDKTISLWNLATGGYHGCLTGHTDRIPALAWHPDSTYLVSVGWDTSARVWDANTLQPVIILNSHAAQVHALSFSRDGRWLACADSSHTVHVWDFAAKKTIHKLKVPVADRQPAFTRERRQRQRPQESASQSEIRTIAFSPDGKYLACNGDRIIHLWNPENARPCADIGPRTSARTTVSLDPTGTKLLSNGGGSTARIWNTQSRQVVATLPSDAPLHALAFSPDGKWIAGSVNQKVRLWDAAGNVVATWEDGPEEPITTFAFSPDSKLLATGSEHGLAVWIWRVADGEPILIIPDALNGCSIESLAFLPDSNQLAVGGLDRMATAPNDGAVCIWNLSERAEVSAFFDGATAVAVHPSGDVVASTTTDHTICLWDLAGKHLAQELVGHDGPVTCLAYSPDGNWLATGSDDQTLRLWDARGHEQMALEVESQVVSVAFSADGRFLYLGHANTTCSQIQLPEPFSRR